MDRVTVLALGAVALVCSLGLCACACIDDREKEEYAKSWAKCAAFGLFVLIVLLAWRQDGLAWRQEGSQTGI